MEPHELAIAALKHVVLSDISHRLPTSMDINTTTDTSFDHEKNKNSNSQLTIESQALPLASTPSTSNSNGFSCPSTTIEKPLSQLSQLSHIAATQQPLNSKSSTRPTTAGRKRTANGHVKSASVSASTSSSSSASISPNGQHHVSRHSRNVSMVSNLSAGTQLGDMASRSSSQQTSMKVQQLSSELRTRLSYAMIKVNNGWQSHSIDEVESLASQGGSPASSASTFPRRQGMLTSPRTAIASVQVQSSSLMLPITHGARVDFDLNSYTRPDPSQTYESFWRDHSVGNTHNHSRSPSAAVVSPAKVLAPPPDIRPAPISRRACNSKLGAPPRLPRRHGEEVHSPHAASAPHTPQAGQLADGMARSVRSVRSASSARGTPSQNTTMQEQDAIETLLFMSSPGNSGSMGPSLPAQRTKASPQHSPLRTELRVQSRVRGRRVGDGSELDRSHHSLEAAGRLEYGMLPSHSSDERSQAIERLLDEMGDSSSDDEMGIGVGIDIAGDGDGAGTSLKYTRRRVLGNV